MNPAILDQGRTPEEWVEAFSKRGIKISERELRREARRLGACHSFGKALILMPEHIDRIFAEAKCPSPSTNATDGGGSKAGSTGYRAANTTDKALAYLQRCRNKKQGSRSRSSKPAKSNVITLATKKR
jgi:hypothetical protein